MVIDESVENRVSVLHGHERFATAWRTAPQLLESLPAGERSRAAVRLVPASACRVGARASERQELSSPDPAHDVRERTEQDRSAEPRTKRCDDAEHETDEAEEH